MFEEPDRAELQALLQSVMGRRVAVIGDAMVDQYQEGRIGRISPEAPVPVVELGATSLTLGGAANVAKCLVALGAEVELCAAFGNDPEGETLVEAAARARIGTGHLVILEDRPTTIKIRIMAENRQIIRLDKERADPLLPVEEQSLISRIDGLAEWADALILSDYGKGVLTETVRRKAIVAAGAIPVVVDPKNVPWDGYQGATVIKPNAREAQLFTGETVGDDAHAEAIGYRIAERLGVRHVLITRGGDGMTLVESGGPARHLRAHEREVFDLTGSGDVVAAVMGVMLAAEVDVASAAWLANLAASINVSRLGASAVSGEDMLDALDGPPASSEHKIMTRRHAADLAEWLRRQGKTVVFTNGCFDILHLGHVTHLERSRRLGGALIVGLNTDASVARLKGPDRPLQREHDRARIIASMGCVDGVVLFDEDTPFELIEAIQPDVLTKGADYGRKENVVGHDLVERRGGRVVLIDLVVGCSTTGLIGKARQWGGAIGGAAWMDDSE